MSFYVREGQRIIGELKEVILDLTSKEPLINAQIAARLGLQCGRYNEKDDSYAQANRITEHIIKAPEFLRQGDYYSPVETRQCYDSLDVLYERAQDHLIDLLRLVMAFIYSRGSAYNSKIDRGLGLFSEHQWVSWSLCSVLVNQGLIRETRGNGVTKPYIIISLAPIMRQEIVIREKERGVSAAQIRWLNSISRNIRHARRCGEYHIPGTRYRADGWDPSTNTIYEYHGCFWHGCPRCYAPDAINARSKRRFGDLYEQTLHREGVIRDLGYNLVVRWECE